MRSYVAAIIASFGSFLFGYHTAIISGALIFLKNEFDLTTFQEELVVSTLLIGAMIGALLGSMADRIGRKKALFVSVILFSVGTLILTDASGLYPLLIGRFIVGLAIGIVSIGVPLYIAEISPPKNRGTLVSFSQFMITVGILIAYIIQLIFAEESEWRAMFGFSLIPLSLLFVGLFFVEETPSWLFKQRKSEAANKVLHKLRLEKEEVVPSKIEEGTWADLWSAKKALWIGIGIAVFQQITGINAIIYYAPKIFQRAGEVSAESAIFSTLFIGIVNMVITAVALCFIDRLGRRFLLITGLSGMIVSLAVIGSAMLLSGSEEISMIVFGAILCYVSFFAISLGPIAWLLISEIFPLKIRGIAVSVAGCSNWIANYFVSLTFLSIISLIGVAFTFWLYMLIGLFALWFVVKKVPETKGKTLEQIQSLFFKR